MGRSKKEQGQVYNEVAEDMRVEYVFMLVMVEVIRNPLELWLYRSFHFITGQLD